MVTLPRASVVVEEPIFGVVSHGGDMAVGVGGGEQIPVIVVDHLPQSPARIDDLGQILGAVGVEELSDIAQSVGGSRDGAVGIVGKALATAQRAGD